MYYLCSENKGADQLCGYRESPSLSGHLIPTEILKKLTDIEIFFSDVKYKPKKYNFELHQKKTCFLLLPKQRRRSSASNCGAERAFVFATYIVQFLYFLNPKSQTESLPSFSGCTAGLYWTWSETPKTGFLVTWLIYGRSRHQEKPLKAKCT